MAQNTLQCDIQKLVEKVQAQYGEETAKKISRIIKAFRQGVISTSELTNAVRDAVLRSGAEFSIANSFADEAASLFSVEE